MSRYIDADAAYEAACEGADHWDGGCSPYRDDCIREELDKVPTVDVVPVDFLKKFAEGKRGYYSDFVIEAVKAYRERENHAAD